MGEENNKPGTQPPKSGHLKYDQDGNKTRMIFPWGQKSATPVVTSGAEGPDGSIEAAPKINKNTRTRSAPHKVVEQTDPRLRYRERP